MRSHVRLIPWKHWLWSEEKFFMLLTEDGPHMAISWGILPNYLHKSGSLFLGLQMILLKETSAAHNRRGPPDLVSVLVNVLVHHIPLEVPRVWSLDGPVFLLGVLPFRSVQSNWSSCEFLIFFQWQKPASKVQDMLLNTGERTKLSIGGNRLSTEVVVTTRSYYVLVRC